MTRLTRATLVLALGTSACPAMALAQTASQITPPTFAPPPRMDERAPTIPEGAGARAPAGAETMILNLSDVTIEGAQEDGRDRAAADIAAIRSRLTGHPVPLSEVYAAARGLEARYARDGHVLVRVVVPPQRLEQGAVLRLVVVHGFIESVDTSHIPKTVRSRIAAMLASLVGRPDVTMAEIERRLLLAGDTPGVTLRSTLAPGAKSGSTILVVDARYQPVTSFLTLDNSMSSALGHDAFGMGINLNSVLGLGETVYLRASGLPDLTHDVGFMDDTPRNRSLALGLQLPIGLNGLMFNLEATDARTAPRHDATLPGFASRFQRLSERISYPLIRSQAVNLTTQASFDVENERLQVIYPTLLPLSLDRLRVARLNATLTVTAPSGGRLFAQAESSFGINGLGARTAADATATNPLSRQGETVAFHKLVGDIRLDQPLAPHLAVMLRAGGQTAFGEGLGNSEQFGLATLDGISPLGGGSLQGDSGYVTRGEVSVPFAGRRAGIGAVIAPYVFGAYGGVHLEQPTLYERGQTNASAYGAGLRLNAVTRPGLPAINASVEYGRATVDGIAGHPDRVTFSLALQF